MEVEHPSALCHKQNETFKVSKQQRATNIFRAADVLAGRYPCAIQ